MTIINLLIAFGLVALGAAGGVIIMALWNSATMMMYCRMRMIGDMRTDREV